MKIVFMGTPAFAAASLDAVGQAGHAIAGVFTRPDKPVGRGMKTGCSPVKAWALAHDIPVFQPVSFKDGSAEETLRTLAPDMIVVVAYGRILPESVLNRPPLGAINVHASLLPHLRGAAPIQWSVIRGDAETGVTTMHMAPSLDTGDIIFQETLRLAPDETAGSLFDRLEPMGARLLVKTLDALARGEAPRRAQDEASATYAPPITKDMGGLDLTRTARENDQWIRGLSPRPGAFLPTEAGPLRIHAGRATQRRVEAPAGTVVRDGETGFGLVCGDGCVLDVTEMQAPGGKRMAPKAYLLGHTLPDRF